MPEDELAPALSTLTVQAEQAEHVPAPATTPTMDEVGRGREEGIGSPLDDSKRRHYLKKLLFTKLIEDEMSSLTDSRALERFGAPFRQDPNAATIDATNTDLPVLRFVFSKFVCTFPFLARTDQSVFWQDKVQVFMQAFASKRISSSEDRAESSKREKLASRIKSMLVLLLNAGVHAGEEESITVDEAEKRTDEGVKNLEINASEGQMIHGFDINVAGVRLVQKLHKVRRRERHSEFLVRTRRSGKEDVFVARRYGAFKQLHTNLREEFPGKQVPRLPQKNKAPATAASYIPAMPTFGWGSASRQSLDEDSGESAEEDGPTKQQTDDAAAAASSVVTLIPREKQRLTLRSFLRRLVRDPQIAQSTSLRHFLLDGTIKLSEEEQVDCQRRRDMDQLRQDEQIKFLEVARERAKELDQQMNIFKRQLIQENGLTKIFSAIRECDRVEDLPAQYIKVIEWGRIELAATLYQIFVADDNSSEMFAQAKRIHSLFPYMVLKNIIRFSNPMTMMRAGIDLFLATPFGRASLFQRMFSSTLNEEIREIETSIEALRTRIDDEAVCEKIRAFVHAREDQQALVRLLAQQDGVDLLMVITTNVKVDIGPKLSTAQIDRARLANRAWHEAIAGGRDYPVREARLYGLYAQLLKLYTRQRDKQQLTDLLFDGATSNLLKDIVGIFYEPLARVYKAASIHNSIMDFSRFAEDCIATVERAGEQDLSTDPNALVQSFIDLTGRHQNAFFHFVHEAHSHDDGLFGGLMAWVELVLGFLRDGAPEQLDLTRLFDEAAASSSSSSAPSGSPDGDGDMRRKRRRMDGPKAVAEIDACIEWNGEMKVWRAERLRRKMAASATGANNNHPADLADGMHRGRGGGGVADGTIPTGQFSGADFGLDQNDLDALLDDESDVSDDDDDVDGEEGGNGIDSLGRGRRQEEEDLDALDPLEAELGRRRRTLRVLQRRFGEPAMPPVSEIYALLPAFKQALRRVLASTGTDRSFA